MTPAANEKRRSLRSLGAGVVYVLLANALWSYIPLLAKVVLRFMDALTLSTARILLTIAGFLLLGFLRKAHLSLSRRDLPWLLLGGLGMGGNYILYIMGVERTTASAASLVVQVEVVSLILFGWIFLHEKMTGAKLLGILLTMAGVGVVLLGGRTAGCSGEASFFGNLLVFLSGPAWGFYGLSQKVLASRGTSSLGSLVWIFITALAVCAVPTALFHQPVRPMGAGPAAALVCLALFCTVAAYAFLARGFRMLDASTVGSITSILPVFTIVNAYIWLGEPVTVRIALGAVLVVAGILTVAHSDAIRTVERR